MRRRQTSVRIDGPDYKKLEKQAKTEGLNVADLIRRAIREFVKKKK
jgi:predicted DNA-binding ribbon-helix-helix protein